MAASEACSGTRDATGVALELFRHPFTALQGAPPSSVSQQCLSAGLGRLRLLPNGERSVPERSWHAGPPRLGSIASVMKLKPVTHKGPPHGPPSPSGTMGPAAPFTLVQVGSQPGSRASGPGLGYTHLIAPHPHIIHTSPSQTRGGRGRYIHTCEVVYYD
jgi:hypothetical protein